MLINFIHNNVHCYLIEMCYDDNNNNNHYDDIVHDNDLFKYLHIKTTSK